MRFSVEVGTVLVVALGMLGGCGMLLRPLLPWRARPFLPFLSPFLGLALISGVCHDLGAVGLSLARMVWLFIALAAAGWATALARRWLRRPPREILQVAAVCAMAFLVAALPLLSLGYLTTVGDASDAVSYTIRSEYLQHAALRLPDWGPGQVFLGLARAHMPIRAGDVYLIGLLGLLTGHRSFELLTVVMALFFALTPGAVFVWARLSLRLSRRAALWAAGLVGINNLVLWPVLDDFNSQVIGLSLFPLLLVFGVEGWRRSDWRAAAVFGILLATLTSIYPVFAVYAALAIAVYWLVAWLRGGRRTEDLPRRIGWWLTAAGCAVAANGVALYRSFWELSSVAQLLKPEGALNLGRGNILVFPSVYEVAGLVSHLAAAMGRRLWLFPRGTTTLLALAAAGFAVYGWWKLAPRSRLAAGTLLLVSAALATQQRYGVNLPNGYPYGYFKAVSIIPLEALVLLAAGLAAAWRRPALRAATALALLAIVCLNLMNTGWTLYQARQNRVVVTRELIELGRAAAAVPASAWILVDMTSGLEELWIDYFWNDHLRIAVPRTPLDLPPAPFFRWALIDKQLDEQRRPLSGEPWYDPSQYVVAWQNAKFALRRRSDATLAAIRWEAPVLRQGERCELKLAAEQQTIEGDLAGRRSKVELAPGTPRRVQISAFSAGNTPARLEVDGAAPLVLGDGGWLLDLDLACRHNPNRVTIRNVGSTRIFVSELRVVSSTARGTHPCLDLTPLAAGAAYVEQVVTAAPRVRYQALLWAPRDGDGRDRRLYRLGVHIGQVATGRPFGVWSLDFAAGRHMQHGSLEIDLRDGRSRAELDGRPATADVALLQPREGSFGVSTVVWQLNPVAQVTIDNVLWFDRAGDGSITISKASSHPRLAMISPL